MLFATYYVSFQPDFQTLLKSVGCSFDVLFIIDIFVAIMKRKKKDISFVRLIKYKKNNKLISYFKTFFVFDVLSCIPFNLLATICKTINKI